MKDEKQTRIIQSGFNMARAVIEQTVTQSETYEDFCDNITILKIASTSILGQILFNESVKLDKKPEELLKVINENILAVFKDMQSGDLEKLFTQDAAQSGH